jgi:hypothetical protein
MTIDVCSIHRALNFHLLYLFALFIPTSELSVQPDFRHTFTPSLYNNNSDSRVLRGLDRRLAIFWTFILVSVLRILFGLDAPLQMVICITSIS